MWRLTQLTWILAALIGTWGMAGFVPHLWRPERRAAWWFALAVVLLLLKAGGRSLWWDGLEIFVGDARATAWRAGQSRAGDTGGVAVAHARDALTVSAA